MFEYEVFKVLKQLPHRCGTTVWLHTACTCRRTLTSDRCCEISCWGHSRLSTDVDVILWCPGIRIWWHQLLGLFFLPSHCPHKVTDRNRSSKWLCSDTRRLPAWTAVASKLLQRAGILQDSSCCTSVQFSSSAPGAPSYPTPLLSVGGTGKSFQFTLRLNQSPDRKTHDRHPCPTCSSSARTPYRGKQTELMAQKTTHFGENRAEGQFRICLWLSLTNPWPDPPGWSKQCGALRRFIWMVDKSCTAQPGCWCPLREHMPLP